MRRRQITPYRLVTAGLLTLLTLIVVGNSWGVFQTDIKPEVYLAPGEMLPRYLSAWSSSPYLGSPNLNVGLVPVLAVTALLRGIGLDAEMAFKIYHLLLWALAAWGTARLLRTLVPRAGRWAALIAGVAYIANPYAVAAGSTLAIALPMALLPWLLITITKALRDPRGWTWPAATGLVFFAMSGMNVGVVPVLQLLLVIPLALYVRTEQGLRWREVAGALARCALFVVAVSLYWLVPSIAATATGTQIVDASETPEGINRTSSFVEVLRGLGLWSYYGSDETGPWIPEFAIYLTSPLVILLTMLWPAAALLSLRVVPARLARLSAGTTALAAVVMVGLYPDGRGSSGFALLLGWVLEHVPAMEAFRTTNKIGAGLALAFALVLGVGLARTLPRVMSRPGAGPAVGGLAMATLFALVAPAITGNLYTSPLDVPGYWRQAADAVDEGAEDGRVLLLPGQTRPQYRWSEERPDDLPSSLFSRDAVIPETTPNTSAHGANYLAALDDTLQSGNGGSHHVSPYARYLGADQILLRHDVAWEGDGGARPGTTSTALSSDPGLRGLVNFGEPGENTFTVANPPVSVEESLLPPLQLYGVRSAPGVVRAAPVAGSIVVAGDAWSVPALAREDLLAGDPTLRYAADLDADELSSMLGEDGRLVVTDTNQRRSVIANRLTAGQAAVLAADEDPGLTRALGDDPDDQSVLVRDGVEVQATDEGGTFFDVPSGVAENAIDGDRSTAWLFGDFQGATGERLDLTLPEPTELGEVTIRTTALGDTAIDALVVRAGERRERVTADEDGIVRVDLDGVETDELRLEVAGQRGTGFSLVGISEIDLGLPEPLVAERVTRTPRTLDTLYADLDREQRERFAQTPLDVSLTRVQNTDSLDDDTEQGLRRAFSVPDDREVSLTATARMADDAEPLMDEVLGLDTTYQARSSGAYFDSVERRASQAADGSARTAWVPGGPLAEAWWQIRGPQRTIDDVTVRQVADPEDEGDTAWITGVRILVDGEEVATGEVGEGSATVAVPEGTTGRTVRVVVDEVDDSQGQRPPRVSDIDTGATIAATGEEQTCITVATLDGEPVQMRPRDTDTLAGPRGPATEWVGCGRESLVWGEHQLRPVDGVQLDTVTMRDVQGREPTEPSPPPVVDTEQGGGSSLSVEVGPSRTPYVLSIGQGYDPRWTATLEDGTDLGEPIVVNGYATGWLVESTQGQTIDIRFGPQRPATVALVASGGSLLVAGVLFAAPLARRRREEVASEREGAWGDEHQSGPAEPGGPDPQPAAGTSGRATSGRGSGATAGATAVATTPAESAPAESAPAETSAAGTAAGEPPASSGSSAPVTDAGAPAVSGLPDAAETDEHAPGSHVAPRTPRAPLGERLFRASGRSRLLLEAALALGALLIGGIGAGVGAVLAVLLLRRVGPRPRLLVAVGSALVLVSAILFVLQAQAAGTLGEISASTVAEALVPHHVAGAGLTMAVLGAFLRPVRRPGPRRGHDDHTPPDRETNDAEENDAHA